MSSPGSQILSARCPNSGTPRSYRACGTYKATIHALLRLRRRDATPSYSRSAAQLCSPRRAVAALLRLVSLSSTRSRSLSCGAGIKTICTSRKSIMLIPISATQIYTPARPRSARSAALPPSCIEAHTSHCGPLSYLSQLVVNSQLICDTVQHPQTDINLMRSIHSYHTVSQSRIKADQRRSHHHRSRTRTALSPRRDIRAFVLAESDAVRLAELSQLEAISVHCSDSETCARSRAVVNIIHKAAAHSAARSEPF